VGRGWRGRGKGGRRSDSFRGVYGLGFLGCMAWCWVGIEGVNRSPCGWNPFSGPRACTIYFEALCYLEKKYWHQVLILRKSSKAMSIRCDRAPS
jgi:hypothetical protein